jgi:GH24 family phage-related lysozyme (muramidase)
MSEAGQITEDEGGNKAKTYMDEVPQRNGTIKKVLTGGIGHKLTEAEQDLYREGTEVPPEIRAAWFKSDMEKARTIADSLLPSGGSPELHRILVNMAFNLGDTGIREFTGMLGAINAGDFTRAALEMRYVEPTGRKRAVISKKTPDGTSEETLEETLEETPWWLQTGGRAQRLVDRMYGLVIPRRRPVDPTVPRTGKDVRRLFEEQLPILDGPLPIPTVQPPNDVHREDGASDQAIEDQRMRILGDVRLSDQAIGNFRGMRNGGIMTLRRY